MLKYLFAVGLLALSFTSCTKQEVIVNAKQPKPPYRISGLSDVVLTRSPFALLPESRQYLNVYYESGDQKRVTLGVSGLPAGLTDSFSVRIGYPDFNTRLNIKDAGIPAGAYPVQLTLKADGDTAAKTFPFTITLKGEASCAAYLNGKAFMASHSCSGTNQSYDVFFSRQSLNNDTLLLNNFLGNGEVLKAVFDCRSGSFNAPDQLVGNKTYRAFGSLMAAQGNFTDRIIFYYYETVPGGGTTNCQFQMIAR